jgi:hypothetical protein
MQRIAIIGAGDLGGALAHALARRDLAAAIRLVDETGRVAEGKALDITQAAPIEGFTTELSGSADLSTAAGAAAVIIADRARRWWAGTAWLLNALRDRRERFPLRGPSQRSDRTRRPRGALARAASSSIAPGRWPPRGTGGARGQRIAARMGGSVPVSRPRNTVIPATPRGRRLPPATVDETMRRRRRARQRLWGAW